MKYTPSKLPDLSAWRDFAVSVAPVLVLAVLASWALYHYVDPAPPKHVVIAAGDEDSAYADYAKSYQESLAEDGIALRIQPSSGAMENLKKLRDANSSTDIAFVQDGIGESDESRDADSQFLLTSLGSVGYEPIWIFYRGTQTLERLSQLKSKRIGIGAAGSGTSVLATRLLNDSGISRANAHLLAVGHNDVQARLLHGDIDVAFVIGAPDSAYVASLFDQSALRVMSLDQAEAYARHFPYLHHLVLPHGGIDIAANQPAKDLHLLATTTIVVARDSLHPALVALILKAMHATHDGPDLFAAAREFPSPKDVDLPLNDEAQHYYKSGPPLLQRYLPFWLATLIDRTALALLPVLAVLIPVLRAAPGIYAWRIRRRIYRWYGELQYLETQVRQDGGAHRSAELARQLDAVEEKVSNAHLPLGFSDHLYVLKEHIELVRRKLTP